MTWIIPTILRHQVPLNFSKLVGPDTFVGQYMQAQSATETASAYDFWCGLWLLSLACGRNAYVDRPFAPVYLNLYCILIAASGITRKSSAIRNAMRVGRHIIDSDVIGIIESKTSPGALDQYLSNRTEFVGCAQVAITISELSAFLPGGAAMPVLLTDLYDCPSHRSSSGTLTHGAINQRNIWVSFLSASTPEWLTRVVSPVVMEGGFTSRCMFILAEEAKSRIAWPSEKRAVVDLVPLLQDIQLRAAKYKTIKLNDNALKTFVAWYNRRTLHSDSFNSSFETREDAHVLRAAALLCVNDGTWVIHTQHIQTAVKLVGEVKANAQSLFTDAAQSKWSAGIHAIRTHLLSYMNEPIPRAALFLKCRKYLTNGEFSAIIDTMHESGVIKRFVGEHERAGRPIDYIQATELLRHNAAIEAIISAV